jgi:hypothetical protein
MSNKHYNDIFKIYVASLASTLHHDILNNIHNLDMIDGPSLYISKIKLLLSNPSVYINNFVNLYSNMYDSYIKKESNKLKKIKEFIHSWYSINSANNTIINNNYISIITKVNTYAIKILLSEYYISNAKNHIQMYIRSNDEKFSNDVRVFERQFTDVVYEAVKLSCSKIKNNINDDNDMMIPASQYIAVVRELEKLKKENNTKLITELREEIERLKNELEILKVTTESL